MSAVDRRAARSPVACAAASAGAATARCYRAMLAAVVRNDS